MTKIVLATAMALLFAGSAQAETMTTTMHHSVHHRVHKKVHHRRPPTKTGKVTANHGPDAKDTNGQNGTQNGNSSGQNSNGT